MTITDPARAGIITWDYREQPDTTRLARILSDLTGGLVHVYTPDTGSDQYALLVTTRPVDTATADKVLHAWWRDDNARTVFNVEDYR